MIVDPSHPISAGLQTYPGLDPPTLRTVPQPNQRGLGSSVSYYLQALTAFGTTGTYIDSPYHFHADRAALVELPLQRLVNVPIVVIRAEGTRPATADQLGDPSGQWGTSVLAHRMVAAVGRRATSGSTMRSSATMQLIGYLRRTLPSWASTRRTSTTRTIDPAPHITVCSVPTFRSSSISPISRTFPTRERV